jgi:hypothetical protein
MTEILSVHAVVGSLLIGVAGAILALIVRLVKGDGADALWRSLETFLAGTFGAFLAHTFIYLMLAAGGHSAITVTLTSLFFFIWPGVVNLFSQLAVHHPVIGEPAVLWLALIVGGGVGVTDGLWATHRWLGIGPLAFLLDVTWGLGGSTNGLLLHLVNFAWGEHADGDGEIRLEAHRYKAGSYIKPHFAFTQGAVMSDTGGWNPSTDLFKHESLHIWQNRILGPLFWFSYVGWMIVSFIPALVAGLIGSKVGDALTWWTYFDNPWEVMAYGIANPTDRTNQTLSDGTAIPGWLCWPWVVAIILNAAVTTGFAILFINLFIRAYH